MQHSPALRCDRVDRLGWVEQSPHYVSFIHQSVEVAASLVVADHLIAPFELPKQSKLIISQLRHRGLQWFLPKVAHLNTAGGCCDIARWGAWGLRLRGFTNQLVVHPYQKVVGFGIEPRHDRTERACDPVYGATD